MNDSGSEGWLCLISRAESSLRCHPKNKDAGRRPKDSALPFSTISDHLRQSGRHVAHCIIKSHAFMEQFFSIFVDEAPRRRC
jgi:hypothetical protein